MDAICKSCGQMLCLDDDGEWVSDFTGAGVTCPDLGEHDPSGSIDDAAGVRD